MQLREQGPREGCYFTWDGLLAIFSMMGRVDVVINNLEWNAVVVSEHGEEMIINWIAFKLTGSQQQEAGASGEALSMRLGLAFFLTSGGFTQRDGCGGWWQLCFELRSASAFWSWECKQDR